jgi:hypothetical protein
MIDPSHIHGMEVCPASRDVVGYFHNDRVHYLDKPGPALLGEPEGAER